MPTEDAGRAGPAGRPPPHPLFAAYLVFTAASCGALVMVVEVLGSRVIGPYFGVSLFVWTALIAVTLLSLAVGYAAGGRLADRHPSPDGLYGMVLAAGVLVALVPSLKAPVIEAAASLGLRAGALVSAALLFGPALVLLGGVTPYVVRVAAGDWARLGRTVGLLYAVSTAGSFAGTVLAGYVVVAYLGIARAFHLCGALLVLLGVAYFALFRGRPAAAALLLPFALAATGGSAPPIARMPDGTTVALVDHGDSFYGNVKVVEYAGTEGRTREMMIDGLIQGGIDPSTGQSVYEYAYLMEHLPLAARPHLRSALLVGLGPGVVAGAYARRGIATDVVDIDPLVVRMAERHFGFSPDRPVIVADGRTVLGEPGPRYDAILLDVFNGDITPGHLLSREAIARVRERLADDGVFALNLVGSLAPDARVLPAVARTLRTQFREVLAFPLFDPGRDAAASGNLVILASNGSLEGARRLRHVPGVHRLAERGVREALGRARELPDRPDATLLTDDFNPLDLFEPGLHEGVRRTILETTPAAILLHG